MRVSERMKKWISMALCLCMLVQNCPVVAFAAEDNLCTHHPEHTAECHYAQGSAGAPCTHVHDAECGYREAVAEVKCACEATDENGALVHTEGCGYVAPVEGSNCTHVHDEACGYAAAVEAHECHYECAECANSDVIANQSEDWCGNPLCSQEDAFHVTSCAQYVAPENPQCFCVEKCTEANVWCDVCGFDYTACTGTDTAVTWAGVDLSSNTASFGNNKGTWYLNPDNAATEFYNLIDDKLMLGAYGYVPDRTYITTNASDYRDNLGNDGFLWTDCKNQTIQDGRYYIYVFSRSASQINRIEYIVDVQVRYTVNISVTGAPSGYGGVTLNGSNAGSPQYLQKGGSMTLTVKDVPSHKHTVTYDSSVACTQNGDTYAFSNVNKSFTFKVVYEADEFATVSFGQPEGATISVNGNSTSPVRVIAGMPYTVSVKTNDGYYLTGITVDGATTSLDTTSYNRNLTAGANGAGHIISVTTAKMAISVHTTASITYTKNQDKASLVNAMKDAVYAGSDSTVKNSLTVNYPLYDNTYIPILDSTDIWESVLTAGEILSCNVKESISVKLSAGDVYSQACTLYLYDGDISANGEIKKDYTEDPVKLDGNDFNCACPANFSSSSPTEYRYYTQSGQRLSSAPTEAGKYQVQVKASSSYKANPDAIVGTSWTSWSGLIPFEIVSVPAYSITIENSSGGRVTASKETSIAGKTVTLTIEPDVGYLVDTVSYNGTAITPVEGVYSFAMPAGAVTISATFGACTHETYENGICTLCGVQHADHTGGEATCTEQAVCTVCGASYGELAAHSTTAEDDIAADCNSKAYCSVCDSEYGEVDKTRHDETVTYVNGFCPNCDSYEPAELVDGVYQISNAGNLYWFADKVTNENAAYGSADAILTCDIRVNEGTMTEASTDARVWTPIGKIGLVGNQVVRYPYTGTFEGNGKTVSGLYFNDTSANFDVGLFSYVGEGGTVQNVGIADSYLCGSQSIGAVVGNNFGTVTGCYNTGTVSGESSVGGVVGANSGTVTDCHNSGSVSGESNVGGVVGSNDGTVTDCSNTGTVSGSNDVGGVAGDNLGTVTGCYNTGTVNGTTNVGGVVGNNWITVTNCYNTGTVSGTASVGGVVGSNIDPATAMGTVIGCYNTGTVSGESSVGGVAGNNSDTVTGCYFDSTVYTGDAIGTNEGTATNVEGKSTEQFKSGEVAYLLSQGEKGDIWGQTIGTDPAPIFSDAKVYYGYTSCGDTAAVYTNNANVFPEKPEHTQNPTYTDNHDGTHSASYSCCGTTVTEDHTLTYTAKDNVITAACSANCGYGGTATISATGKTYDGNAVEVIVSKTGSLENTDIPVALTKDGEAFTGEPVNAGTYTASVTLGDKTVSVDFTIAKADAIIALAPTPNSGLTYTGEAQYLISPGSAEGGILVYSLSEDGDLYETIPQGTDAGEYRVWYFVQGDENHNDSARDSVPVTIEKATVTVTADAKTKTYGDADPELTYTASGLFGEDKLTGALTRAEGENVGSYAITQGTLTAGDNYTISFTGAEFAIGVKDVDVMTMEVEVTLEQDSYAYDGTAKEPEVTSIIVDGVKLTEDVDYRVLSYERNIYVGEAELVIHFIGNYRGSLSRFFQITKAPLTVTADSKTMITGQELPTFTYTITGFVGGETEDVLTAKPTVSCEADGKTAGTYGITVSGAAADNYEITHVNGTLTVADHQHAWTYTAEGDTITAICGNGSTCPEAEQTITICAEGKIYDGKPVTAELDGSIEGVDDPEITYSGNTDAGTYTASIKLGKATASVEFTIEKATPTVAWANTSESVNYTGVAAVITAPTVTLVNGEPFGGTISYAYTGTSSGSGLPTNAGTYEITASIDAQGSYNAAASTNKLTLTINKVDPVYTVPTGLTATYGDTLADVALPEGFRWTDSSESVGAVGTKNTTVIYTPADTANYNTVTNIAVSIAVKAAAATVTTAPTPNDLTYTGEAQELITAGEAEGGTMQYQLNGGEWSDKIPTAKDEGIYTVSWKVVGDANHADTEVKSITVTIGDCTHSGNTNKDDADCTTQITCSVCGDVLVEAKAHVWGDWTTTLEPTTTTEGSKERLCTNDGCEAKDTKSIPMLNEVEVPKPEGGDVSVDNPTPATGEDVTITVTPDTGKEVVDVVVRDKNDNEITVTKNEDGTYTYEQPDSDVTVEVILKDTIYTVTWTVDGKTYAEQTYKYGEHITAPADPTKAQSGCTVYTFHKWNGFTAGMTMPDEKELTFAAEFTEEGSHIDDDQNHICDRECGKTDIGLHADAADDKDHVCDYGCGEVLETCSGGTATCMAEAVCAVCGESYGSKDPQNHTGSTHVENAEDPTCAEPGYTGDTVCECGETIGAGEQIPATGEHDYHNGTCSVCGGKDPNYNKPGWGGIWDWIFGGWWGQGNKCDHSYTAVVTAPTCTEKGYTTYTCSKCGDCYKDSYTNALGHAWDKGVVTKEPTCTEDGVKTYTCGRCGHRKTETIQATGHNYQDGICGGCGAQKPTEPSVPDNPDKPNKPVWGGIWDWICGGWWK